MRFLLARRSNRRRLSGFFRVSVAVAVLAAVSVSLMHLPLIAVQSVEIDPASEGTEILHEEVLAYTRGFLGEYRYGIRNSVRYFFRKGAVEERIRERFLHTDTVTITGRFFNRWSVLLMKRETFGTHCDGAACFLIDMNGLVFANTDTVRPGRVVTVSGGVSVGDYLFADEDGAGGTGADNFRKLEKVLTYMEERGIFVRAVAVRKGSHDVHITPEANPGIWINMNESIYDITRALHVTFFEVFPEEERKSVSSVIICDPLNPHWKSGQPWERGCRDLGGESGAEKNAGGEPDGGTERESEEE